MKVLKAVSRLISVVVLAGICSLGATTVVAGESVYKWRAQTYAVPGSVGYKALEAALKDLKEATSGRLDITLYGVGSLVGPFEQLDAMGMGIFECGFNAPAYYAGKDPAFAALFSLMNIWESTEDVKIWSYYFGGLELARELYGKYKVHYVGPALVGAEPIMSKVPLKKLSDFNGIKIRTAGGLTSELFQKLGASPVKMGGGELYTGLDTGVVDAAEFVSLAENHDIGLDEVTEYVLYPSFHGNTATCDFTVNQKAWDKLPDDLKATLETWIYDLDARFDHMSTAESIKALKTMTDKGLVHTTLSPADMAQARAYSLEIAKAWKTKSPMSGKIIDSILDYLRLKGSIQ
ncbi:TRAP transporter substrate-binding protein DctP [Desulforhopalus singaporensis]|uniref:TRAP-type mannitol/chloroaromatic compound transport system, substrate-binding protein n=1 Tax=Desulforhopalus singaporensis TaxID=91360 RepID=A0A1H0RUH1_9BACT|nr:TRAP transporter substrate-binding protein DctP [Desulforhopalus singaporensis]SDP32626.1 TRAP-type mannitol/chloroaromatic compound transport system, substrate-binding protein [Desulforhopalus singaporensis]